MDLNHIPDAAMTIAAMALFAEGTTRIRNIYNWRVKETDRLHARLKEYIVDNLINRIETKSAA